MEETELEMDQSAYEMYHQAQTNAPCLSFDIIKDNLGDNRTTFPHTCYIVAGTQADTNSINHIIVMQLSNLKRTYKEEKENEDSDNDSSSDESEDEDEPELEAALISHSGCINRIRTTTDGSKTFAASWSDTGAVYIWDLNEPLDAVKSPNLLSNYVKKNSQLPLFKFSGHLNEGFAIDWSPVVHGLLATGDCLKNIHIWRPTETSWNVDQRSYVSHSASVEDIQWSPNEQNVFASCSVDKSIKIWDCRALPSKACMITCSNAHESDVNVISWNKNEPFIASGGDDGVIKIWDLRVLQESKPVGVLKHHTKPITSIEWNQNDSTVFAASGEDDLLTIWDLAIEKDDNEETMQSDSDYDVNGVKLNELPPQLLFIHQGQKEMKELHWHKQIPGVIISTAHSGFNIFKTISV